MIQSIALSDFNWTIASYKFLVKPVTIYDLFHFCHNNKYDIDLFQADIFEKYTVTFIAFPVGG